MKKISLLLLLVFAMPIFKAQCQDSLYVSLNGDDNNNGSSWATAFRNIHKALYTANQSTAGSVSIFIGGGIYKPTDGTSDPDNRDTAFFFTRLGNNPPYNTLRIYGGYNAATGMRDIAAYPVYLDGNLGNPDSLDNSRHVVVIAGITTDTLIVDGFTIRNGFSEAGGLDGHYGTIQVYNGNGAGLYVANDYPNDNYPTDMNNVTLRNCTLSDNYAYGTSNVALQPGGGGGYLLGASPVIENCRFLDNHAEFITGSLTNNAGGGLLADYSNFHINSCTFSGNYGVSGGGIYAAHGLVTMVDKSGFMDNAASYGSALFLKGKTTITGCVFSNNISPVYATDVYDLSANDTLEIINCLYVNNQSSKSLHSFEGGAGAAVRLSNNTYYGNSSLGAPIFKIIDADNFNGSTFLSNSIIWNNTSQGSPDPDTSVFHVSYCDIKGGAAGTGNLNIKPGFADTSIIMGPDGLWATGDDGLRLAETSPCINAGNNSEVPASLLSDVSGATPRILQARVDMGAFECFGSGPNGIREQKGTQPSFLLYPNPAHDEFTIACADLSVRMTAVQLSDISGRALLSPGADKMQNKFSMALPHRLPAGTYFVSVYFSNGYTAVKKLVKD